MIIVGRLVITSVFEWMNAHLSFLSIIIALTAGTLDHAGAQESKPNANQQINLRIEFYDLPADEALRIQQEVSIQPDQTKAREKILKMVEAGDAAFVSSAPLVCRSGVRGKYQDTEVVPVIEIFTWNQEAKRLVPKFANRNVGTVFEVDPTLSADGETLDLNFALEHHTGEPVKETILVPLGDPGDSKEVSVTRFHMKKITTHLFIKSGATALIGAFEITGPQPSSSSSSGTIPNAKRLVFLSANLQKPDKD